MRIPRSVPLLPLLLALLASTPLPAQEAGPARITVGGVVLDATTGAPVPDAVIALPQLSRRVVTDPGGRFVLREIPPGTHQWVVSRIGYASWDQEVAATEDGAQFTAALLPRPQVLEGITVVVDRFETRRKSSGTSVRAVERRDILSSAAANAMELLPSRAGLLLYPCSRDSYDLGCALVRGRLTQVAVYIDDQPALGGVEQLRAYTPQEIYTIEAYHGGEAVFVYTVPFVENLAKTRGALQPVGRVRMRSVNHPTLMRPTRP